MVDSRHIYVPAQLSCTAPVLDDHSREMAVRTGDPADLTAQWAHVDRVDVVEPVGYPRATSRTFAVVRRGVALEALTWHALAGNAWTLGVVQDCGAVGL